MATMLTSDGFSAADGAINGGALDLAFGGSAETWIANVAIVRISGKLGVNSTTGFKVARTDTGTPNGYVEFFYDTLHGTHSVTVIGRSLNGSNFYNLQCRSDGTILLYATVAGVDGPNLFVSSAGVGGAGKRIGLGCVGTTITAFIGGVLVGSVIDSSLTAGNTWGLGFGSADLAGRIDNFKVFDAPPTSAVPGPLSGVSLKVGSRKGSISAGSTRSRLTPSRRDAGLNTTFVNAPPVTGTSRSILSFGATPNNSADDDGPAIRNAIAACSAGDEVYIPNGIYHVKGTAAISLKDGVSVRGQSRSGAVLSAMFTSEPGAFLIASTSINNLTLSDFTITSASGAGYAAGIRLGTFTDQYALPASSVVARMKIDNLHIDGFRRFGVELDNAQHILVTNCEIRDATALDGGGSGYGVCVLSPGSNNIWINNNTIGPVIRHAVIIANGAHHNLVDYNTITATVSDAIDMHGEDEYSNEIAYNTIFDGVRNGTTVSPNGSGIGIGEWSGTVGLISQHDNSGAYHWVHHNDINNYSAGIRSMNNSDYIWIEDNVCRNNDSIGIGVDFGPIAHQYIYRNNVHNNASGISMNDCTSVEMKDNIVQNNTSFGIVTNSGTTGYLITQNTISGNGTNVSLGSVDGTYVP